MQRPDAARYAVELRAVIRQRGISIRKVGRLVEPSNPEVGRRRVMRHLSGRTAPSRASQQVYARVLNAPQLGPDEDPEDEDLSAGLTRELKLWLDRELAARVHA